jgi:hypothetical protein
VAGHAAQELEVGLVGSEHRDRRIVGSLVFHT